MHPQLFALGPLHVYSYGVFVALGGLASVLIWKNKRDRMGLAKDEDFWLLVNVILISGFIGGRLLFILEYVPFIAADLWDAIFSFNKGFSVLGAFASVIAGVWWFTRKLKLSFLGLLDYVALIAPLWHVFGRIGCFAAGCCFGKPTAQPWGVIFTDPTSMVARDLLGTPLHPTQLYEAFGDLGIFLALYFAVLPRIERGRLAAGTLSGAYFLAYGILRFVLEFYRGDGVAAGAGLTAGQWLAIVLSGAGLSLIAWAKRPKPCTQS
jgi:phosphatidylglycerol:prolipoprotein diacylglycerol transferase